LLPRKSNKKRAMTTETLKIGIFGCSGRMGKALLAEVINSNDCQLSGGLVTEHSSNKGRDLGELAGLEPLGIATTTDIDSFLSDADVVIDFTSPTSTLKLASLCVNSDTTLIVGTTGLSDEQIETLDGYAKHTAIVFAPNMSVGVNLLLGLVEKVAATLDESVDIEIVEMHHRHKVDSPSGTALGLGKAAADGRKVALSDVACYARDGIIGERPPGEIGFATLRGGDVVGEHTVIFADEGERIELTHKASSRTVFARGAVRAAKWAAEKPAKLYSMKDVLGL
jgi:4-hydroxy-tetrahydrodipicolinate reductase